MIAVCRNQWCNTIFETTEEDAGSPNCVCVKCHKEGVRLDAYGNRIGPGAMAASQSAKEPK